MSELTPAGHDARAVANAILAAARQKGIGLTMMQLVKLIYYAQGWYLAFCDRELTRDVAEAWQYGPVYPNVYRAVPSTGSNVIDAPIYFPGTKTEVKEELSEDELSLIDWVVDEYGKIHAFDLSRMTHEEGSPWKQTVDKNGIYSSIPKSLMKSYFKTFIVETEQNVSA